MIETTLYSFTGPDGAEPVAGVTLDAEGDIFGTTLNGGSTGNGTVFEIKAGTTTATTLYSFTGVGTDGAAPYGGVTLDTDGDIFGTTGGGGTDGGGTVFEILAGTTTVTTLYSFNGTDGAYSYAGVTLDADDNIFGTTAGGGSDGSGTVFEIPAGTATAVALYSFTNMSYGPHAIVTLDAAGDIFGTTPMGGAYGEGSVFEIPAGTTTATTLYDFGATGTDGIYPTAGLTLDAAGDIFGTTSGGGTNGGGTVFEIPFGSTTTTTIYSFSGGVMPNAGVTLDAAGDIFGTTSFGGGGHGSVFEIKAGTTLETTLYSFTGTDGSDPLAGVTLDSDGDIFGTTSAGGSGGDGTVFEIQPTPPAPAPAIYSFTGAFADGADPQGDVTLDAAGDIFGTTEAGGSEGQGTVFEIKAGTTTATTLYSFTNNGPSGSYPGDLSIPSTDGSQPTAGVRLDAEGDIFGTTQHGGSDGDGTVFEIQAGSTSAMTLYSFTGEGTDGANPYAGVTLDANGDIFGTTVNGGANEDGTVFEIPGGSGTATLYSFTGDDGASPNGGITIDANGDLFGTTSSGGANDGGTVFEIQAGSTTPTTLYSFTENGVNGSNPYAGVTLDSSSNIFGTTTYGGSAGDGTVFEITAGTTTATTLYSFTGEGTDGATPEGGVTLDAQGDIFGTTSAGGANGDGTAFEIKAGTTTATTLYSFTGSNGADPMAGVTIDANGNIFGTTDAGGSAGYGTVFEIPSVACYCADTLILTTAGEVAVQDLSIGDQVVTAAGASRPIKWIGKRSYAGVALRSNPEMQPVRFQAGCLGNGLPRRDLLVSPKHAMFLDDMLIPAECLVSGVTIIQEQSMTRVEYFHIELETHDVILAEGAPSETFIDDDSRSMFHNLASYWQLYPDAMRVPAQYCAPRVEDGFELEAVRQRLLMQARILGRGGYPADSERTLAAA